MAFVPVCPSFRAAFLASRRVGDAGVGARSCRRCPSCRCCPAPRPACSCPLFLASAWTCSSEPCTRARGRVCRGRAVGEGVPGSASRGDAGGAPRWVPCVSSAELGPFCQLRVSGQAASRLEGDRAPGGCKPGVRSWRAAATRRDWSLDGVSPGHQKPVLWNVPHVSARVGEHVRAVAAATPSLASGNRTCP